MPLSSYRVESPVYIAPPPFVKVKAPEIKAEEIKSNQIGKPGDETPNVSSYPWGEWKPKLEKGPYGETYIVTKTSNNKYRELATDFLKPGHGYLSQRDDYQIDGMKRAGEDNPPNKHNLIPRISDIIDMRGIAYIEGPYSRMNFADPRDTSANVSTHPTYVNAVDINSNGLYVSRKANFERLFRSLSQGGDYHFEAKEWVDFLASKGITYEKADTSGFRGYGILNDVARSRFLWAYIPDLGYMIAEGNVHNRIQNQVKGFGLTGIELREAIDAFKRADVLHETGHLLGIKGDRKPEMLQGLLRAEFYTMMAQKYPRYARIYRALAREGMQYAEEFSLENAIEEALLEHDKEAVNEIEAMSRVMGIKAGKEADALELKGKARQLYIRGRVYDALGPLLESEPAYKNGLEKIVRRENIRIMIDEDGKVFPVYRGRRVYGEDGERVDEKTENKKLSKADYKSMSDARRDAKDDKAKDSKSDKAEESEADAEMAEAA